MTSRIDSSQKVSTGVAVEAVAAQTVSAAFQTITVVLNFD